MCLREAWLKFNGAKMEMESQTCGRCGQEFVVRMAVTQRDGFNEVDVLEIYPPRCKVGDIPHSYATAANLPLR